MRNVRIEESEKNQRLDKYLQRFLPGAGRGLIYKSLRKKNIVLNGQKASGNEMLQAGDQIRLYFSEESLAALQRSSIVDGPVLPASWIVYEDDRLLLVQKPVGLLTQKAKAEDYSLADYVSSYWFEKHKNQIRTGGYRPGPANRLDRNTGGLVLFPLRLDVAQEIAGWLRNGLLQKGYLALVEGRIPWEERTFTGYISRDAEQRKSHIVAASDQAKKIVTTCQVLDRQQDNTLLRVFLHTGKTHQIRTQLADAGFPIWGDPKYGSGRRGESIKEVLWEDRQFLYASSLCFPNSEGIMQDLSGKKFTALLPESWLELLQRLGFSVDRLTGEGV